MYGAAGAGLLPFLRGFSTPTQVRRTRRTGPDELRDLERLIPDLMSQGIVPGVLRISVHADHLFRRMSITHFGRCRSALSVQADHPFRSMSIIPIGGWRRPPELTVAGS
jgi:hypothetical protein